MKKNLTTFLSLIFLCCIINTSYAILPTPVLIYPPNNSTGISTTLTFDWSDVSGATYYHLQVLTGITPVIDLNNITSSQYTVPSNVLLGNTQYYWRVKAHNSSDSSNWTAYWNFWTAVVAPGPPTLLAPPDGTQNVPVTPTLDWTDVQGASTYQVQVALDANFNSISIDVPGLASSQYSITQSNQLANGTTYFWRARAANSGGNSPWSSTWHFSTAPAPPGPPNLIAPPNNAVNVTLTPTMQWSVVPGATGYHFQIGNDAGFNSIAYDTLIPTATTSNTVPTGILAGNYTYYWRVYSINSGGQGGSSVVWHFTTQAGPPPAPILVLPANAATCINRFPLLDWQDVTGAQNYTLQISTDPNFGTTILNVTVTTSQYQVSTNILTNNTVYYWRVRASNSGGPGPWSEVWNFRTVPSTPNQPTLLGPPNNAQNISLTPTFSWTVGSGAEHYTIQVSPNQNFTQFIVNSQVDSTQLTIFNGLSPNTQYWWRVQSVNCGGVSTWAGPWTFRTLQTLGLNIKVLLEGFYNGSTQVQDTVRVYLANPTSPFQKRDSATVYLSNTGTALLGFQLAPNGNYYIIVKHRNHLETWSSLPQSFTTGNPVNYDFSTGSNKAYGNNMKQVGSVWVLYGGDINQDGTIDPDDYTIYKTQFGRDGYKPSDLNGDNFIDGYDLPIIYSNFYKNKITP